MIKKTLSFPDSGLKELCIGNSLDAAGDANFINRLEALRGVAAMIVAVSHSLRVLQAFGWQSVALKGLSFLFTGNAAVSLFFVLSGLVLGLSLRRQKTNFTAGFIQYSFRRVLRIWPAFMLCTAVIAGYLWFIYKDQTFPTAGPWYTQAFGSYHTPLTFKEVFRNSIFLTSGMNNVTWTLPVEIGCSFLLPFVHWLTSRQSNRCGTLLLIFFVILCFDPNRSSTAFMFMFVAGYLIPTIGPKLFSPSGKLNANVWLVLGAIPFLLYPPYPPLIKNPGYLIVRTGFLMEGVGATILISGLMYGRQFKVYRLLDHPIVQYYGRISYSFYLWHCFCLYLVSRVIFDLASNEALRAFPTLWTVFIWFFSTAIATGVSHFSYQWIEKPFIQLSKKTCKQAQIQWPTFFS